jgi:hypothetical protein
MPGGVAGAQSIMVAPYADPERLEFRGAQSLGWGTSAWGPRAARMQFENKLGLLGFKDEDKISIAPIRVPLRELI